MSLTVIDIIYIIIVLLFAFNGFRKGFFGQLFNIIGIVLGLFLAYFFADDLSPLVAKIIGDNRWNNLVSFILIFIAFFLLCQLLNRVFKESLEAIGAQGIDKIFGFSFGLAQGWIIVTAITLILTIQPFVDPGKIFNGSTIGNKIISIIPELEKIYPDAKDFLEEMELIKPEENKEV